MKSGKQRGDLIDVLLDLKHSKEKDRIYGKFLQKFCSFDSLASKQFSQN